MNHEESRDEAALVEELERLLQQPHSAPPHLAARIRASLPARTHWLRRWLGLDGWPAGVWRPAALALTITAAGFLVGVHAEQQAGLSERDAVLALTFVQGSIDPAIYGNAFHE